MSTLSSLLLIRIGLIDLRENAFLTKQWKINKHEYVS